MLVHAITADLQYEFAADVRAGLTKPGQKELLSKYLYDDVGSALFEVICHLPEYGLTRADERLLRRHAGDIVDRLTASGCRRGTRQRQRQEDSSDSRSSLSPPAYPLLSHRDFSHCPRYVRARIE